MNCHLQRYRTELEVRRTEEFKELNIFFEEISNLGDDYLAYEQRTDLPRVF